MTRQEALLDFTVRIGDSSLILGHRLSEWCSRGPFLEEDIATTNIALDLVGQARIALTYAGEVEGKGRTEDDFAYGRTPGEFRSALLTQLPNGDFGDTTARQLYFSAFSYLLFSELKNSKDETLAGLGAKAIKEVTYHLRHCSEWTVRLGDGTDESKMRMQKAIDSLWPYTGDLFATTEGDELLVKEGIIPDLAALKPKWVELISDVLKRATLTLPDVNAFQHAGSRKGHHTEHLSYIVGEMQTLTRMYPGAKW
jgi:ring-1,2-phenylacetyl-CoA epoxidase subunit PaaC